MAFSEKLKTLRTTHHLSQRDLADRVGVGKSQISYYENDNPIYKDIRFIKKILQECDRFFFSF